MSCPHAAAKATEAAAPEATEAATAAPRRIAGSRRTATSLRSRAPWRRSVGQAKATTMLNAQDRVILFCAATGIDHAAVGILAHAMQSMTIRGFIAHNRESGAYALTGSGRATLMGDP